MDELSATIVNPAQSFSISNPHANEDWNSQIIEGQRLVSDASDEITIFQNPMFQRDLSHKTGYRREKKVIILFLGSGPKGAMFCRMQGIFCPSVCPYVRTSVRPYVRP